MQKRKSFFNNEMEQRFSLRKYTIGLCSVCLGFVVIGMGSQTVKADTVNDAEKSSAVQENKTQDMDSANADVLAKSKPNTSDLAKAKPNATLTETKENEAGLVAMAAPKTAGANNAAVVNTSDQSKSEDSSAVAPTSEKTQLQTSQDSSIKSKENSLNNKSNAMKAVFKLTNLNKENNSSDPNSKEAEVKPKESSNVDTNEQKEKDVTLATNSPASETNASSKPVQTVSPEQSADTTDVQPASGQLESAAINNNALENDVSAASASTVLSKQPANAATQPTATTSGVQPFVNLAVESDNNDLTPKHETVTSRWTIHYVKYGDHQQELKAPTVITRQYTRTNTLQSNGKIRYGDWSYVLGSFKLTGTPIAVNGSDNPTKEDNVDKDGKNYDVFSIVVQHPDITGYELHNVTNGVRISDLLQNDDSDGDILAMSPTMNNDRYVEYDVAKERSIAVKFVDDQYFKQQVGQAITLTGHDGDTVNLNLTVPDKYQLANGQQLPTTYTFTKDSGDLTIHLVHKVVQREATIDVKLGLITFVDFGDKGYEPGVVTQAQWAQLKEEEAKDGPVMPGGEIPFTEVGTLTGHVGYDLVDEEAVSFGDDWTSLNLGSRTYQLPNGTDVVNGILIDSDDTMGKKLKEYYLNEYQNWDSNKHVDPDYANRPWHGYLSVNATNNTQTPGSEDVIRLGMQAGLAGNESNILAKATGDRAATAVELVNKTIDVSWLQDNLDFGARDFSEHNGQLKAKTGLIAFGVYIPYVEKTATRTINVITPDGKTTTVKQTATLAKQVDFGKDAHPAWTTGEWASYDAPVIPGYTASQSNVAKEAVTGTTKDQTVNITYTANPQTTTVVYQTEDGTPVHTTTVNGQTGQTVKVSNEVPAGWMITKGQVPSEITFGPNGIPQTVVTIAHQHVTVDPDHPQNNGTKLPDNSAKTFSGVEVNDLNKTIIRTINVTTPDGKTNTTKQTAKLTRTAEVDEVTGEVTYGNWTTGKWSNYDAPTVPGYTASQSEVPATEVTSDTADQTININYTANSQTIHINYVDDDNAGKIVHATTVTGKTGETVSLNLTVPDKYQLADGQQLPTTYTFTAGSGDVTIHLAHKIVQREAAVDVQIGFITLVDLSDEADPAIVVTQNQWRQLDDEIKKHALVNDLEKVYPTVEVGTLTGHVNYDLVDNKVVSFADDWTSLNLGGQTYQMPDGTEVVNGIIVGTSLSWGEKLKEHILKYVPDIDPDYATYSWHGYLSVNKSHIPSDLLVGNEPNALAKATGDRAATAIEMPNNPIDLSSLQNPFMGGGLSDFNEQDGQLRAKAISLVDGMMYIPYVEKTATRTINVTTPDGKTTSVKQTTTLAKQIDFGEDAHRDWTTGEWTSYDVPVIPGYTASQLNVAKEAVTGTTKDQTVNITYTANDGTQTIIYQGEDDSEIGKQVIHGKTDETVKVTPDVPDGYVVKGEVPSEVTIKPDDTPITVTVEHGKSHIDPDKPVNSGEHIPGTTDKTYPSGLTHDDLNKTITREVTITDPTGKKTTTTQTVTFTRGATVDEVTNEVTYDDWSENGKHTFDKVDVPTVQGYTASGDVPSLTVTPDSQSTNVTVTYNANEQTATITYIDDTEKKTLISDKQNGKFNQVITFEHDPTEVIKGLEEKGYKLVSNDFNGNKYQADNSNNVFYVHLEHQHQDIDADHIPSGAKDKDDQHDITADDFSKKITRTIEFETPTNQSSTSFNTGTSAVHHDQQVTLQRHGDYDKVTGLVTWKAWSEGDFDTVNVGENGIPTFDGYNIDPDNSVGYNKGNHRIDAIHVTSDTKPSVVIIRYKAQDHTVTYHFVNENGKQQTEPDGTTPIADETVSGKTDDMVNTPTLPDGWVLDGDTLDSTIKVPSADKIINVKIKHGQVTVTHDNPVHNGDKIPGTMGKTYGDGLTKDDLNQQGTRTIVFNFPKTYSLDDAKKVFGNGDKYTQVTYDEARDTAIVIQTIHFTRDAVVDTVTGKVVEYKGAKEFTNSKTGEKSLWNSDPASGSYAAVKIPKISGYKSKLEHVKDQTQVTRRGLNFARYYMVNFMALPSNPNSSVPSEPAKTPGTNPGDVTHVDKPGEVDNKNPQKPNEGNKGQDQGNKGQNQDNKGQDQGGQKTDDHKGQTSSGNTDNTQKSAKTKPSNNDQKPADNPNADNTKLDEDVNSTDYKFDGKKSGNDLDTKSSSKKSAKTVVNTTKKTALNGNDKGVTNMVTTVSTTGKASDSVAPKGNIVNVGNGEVAGVRTVQAATVNGSANGAKDLPHTGEKQDMIASILGALASGLGILELAGAKHKKKED